MPENRRIRISPEFDDILDKIKASVKHATHGVLEIGDLEATQILCRKINKSDMKFPYS